MKTNVQMFQNDKRNGWVNVGELEGCVHFKIGWLVWCDQILLYVSESDILGPMDHFSNIENLVSFEKALFEDNSFCRSVKLL